MKPRQLPILVLGLALLAPACGAKGAGDPAGQTIKAATTYSIQPVALGKRWTPKGWSGTDLNGAPISSREFAGAVTVVNFWASWCGPCRAEQPVLEKLWKEYESKGVKFVGVTVREESRVNALAHVNEFGVTYPSVYTPDTTIAYGYHVLFIPETYVLDRRGKVAWRVIGVTHDADMRRALDAELAR